MKRRNKPSGPRGYAVIETVLALGLLTMVFGGFTLLFQGTRGVSDLGENRTELQEVGRRLMERVLIDLRNSGIVEDNAMNYPAIFEREPDDEGDRGAPFATMSYSDVDLVDDILARDGDGDRIERNRDLPSREIVFRLPRVDPVTGLFINDQGIASWGDQEISYRVSSRENGVNWLERRVNDDNIRPIGPFVDKITFDCIMNDRSLLFDQVAVVIYLSKLNSRGERVEVAIQGVANLRNSEPISSGGE